MGNHGTSSPSDEGAHRPTTEDVTALSNQSHLRNAARGAMTSSPHCDTVSAPNRARTSLGRPHVRRRVEGDDVDVIFEVLQQLVELLRAAAAVGEDLHLVGDALQHPRLDVPQVHPPLLQEGEEEVKE